MSGRLEGSDGPRRRGRHVRRLSRRRYGAAGALALGAVVLGAAAQAATGLDAPRTAARRPAPERTAASVELRQQQFAAAAREFGVPVQVLLAVGYQESLWETHDGLPSTTGNWNVMGLTDVRAADLETPNGNDFSDEQGADARGEGGTAHPRSAAAAARDARLAGVDTNAAALHTVEAAAALLRQPAARLRADAAQSIRGGAALLAAYQRKAGRPHSADPAAWYAAVAAYAQAESASGARLFADRVYQVLRSGVRRTTADGQRLALAAEPKLAADTTGAPTPPAATPCPDPVPGLTCSYVPAAHRSFSTASGGTDYGNYAVADRPGDGNTVDTIVVHDTEGTRDGAISHFQDPTVQASAHYLVGRDGSLTQLVPVRDIAWHAANKTVNSHSVGIEHEGWALRPGTWFTPSEYQTSAALVRTLAARFHLPLDRRHVIGHDEVPGSSDAGTRAQHWDPGPYWDWSYYFALLGSPLSGDDQAVVGGTLTVAPPYTDANQPELTGCSGGSSCPAHPANFVYLYQQPSFSSALFNDTVLQNQGSRRASDWGDKAVYGETFVVAAIQGDWTAIWYGGQRAWFHNPGGRNAYANPAGGGSVLVTAAAEVPVYGVAFPEDRKPVPLGYTLGPGQAYLVLNGGTPVTGDYATCSLESPCSRSTGSQQYYLISYNHRLAYVRTQDVQQVTALTPPSGSYLPLSGSRALDAAVRGRRAVSVALPQLGSRASAVALRVGDGSSPASVLVLPVRDGTAVVPVPRGAKRVQADLVGYWTTDGTGARFVASGPGVSAPDGVTAVLARDARTGEPELLPAGAGAGTVAGAGEGARAVAGWFTTDPTLGGTLHLASAPVVLPAGLAPLAGANGVPYTATAALVQVADRQLVLPVRKGTVTLPAPATLVGWFAP